MKTLKITTLLLALAMVFGSTSCKYEDGPGISLRSKTARVTGDWIIEKYIDANGNEDIEDDSPTYTFEKDGKGSAEFDFLGTVQTIDFTWEFADSKKNLKITSDGDVSSEEILRLTNKEMWLKDSDGDKTYFKAK